VVMVRSLTEVETSCGAEEGGEDLGVVPVDLAFRGFAGAGDFAYRGGDDADDLADHAREPAGEEDAAGRFGDAGEFGPAAPRPGPPPRRAASQCAAGGRRVTAQTAERLTETLDAALVDPGAAQLLRTGQLTSALRHVGFGVVDENGDPAQLALTGPPSRGRSSTPVSKSCLAGTR